MTAKKIKHENDSGEMFEMEHSPEEVRLRSYFPMKVVRPQLQEDCRQRGIAYSNVKKEVSI